MLPLTFVAGLAFLIVGAELLVRGASRLASRLGTSSLVIGLTVVAFGTSSPELAVSVEAALSGRATIALGNVIGSNIFNVLFILGISALVAPLAVSQQLVRLDVPLMIALSGLVLAFAWNGAVGRLEGLALVLGLAAYLGLVLRLGRQERTGAEGVAPVAAVGAVQPRLLPNLLLVGVGLGMLVLGSRWLVGSATSIAVRLGVSELVIALTLVAAGTSLPEVVTSIVATLRGERDIAVGNVVGSNLFNIMGVLGVSSLVSPGGIEVSSAVLRFDIPVMIGVAVACLPIFFTGGVISRLEGVLLIGYYAAYTLYLLLAAAHHEALPRFSAAMLYFVVPLSALGLLFVVLREARRLAAR
jgi:cation:H+ antiporter